MPQIASLEKAAVELEQAGTALQGFFSVGRLGTNTDLMAAQAEQAGKALVRAAAQFRNAAAELESLDE